MEVGVKVESEDFETGEVVHTNSAYYTFVSVDKKTGQKMKVPDIIPETPEEKKRFDRALERRNQRIAKHHGIVKNLKS